VHATHPSAVLEYTTLCTPSRVCIDQLVYACRMAHYESDQAAPGLRSSTLQPLIEAWHWHEIRIEVRGQVQ
jgi:hypothetical protein